MLYIEENAMMQECKASRNLFRLLLLIEIKIHLAFMLCYFCITNTITVMKRKISHH